MKKHILMVVVVLMLSVISVSAVGAQGGGTLHYVTYGDTLYSISAQYGVSAEAIMQANGIVNPNMIYVGQPLMIPAGYGPGPVASGCGNYHVVMPGETLSGIAYQYGLSLHELMMHNSLYNQDMVYAGQKLCVPSQPSYVTQPAGYVSYGPPADAYYHTVAAGEALHGICQKYGVNYADVVRANNFTNANYIMPGQKIYIPGHQPMPPPPPPVAGPLPAPPPAPYPAPPPAPVYGGGDGDYHHDKYPEGSAEAPPAPEYQAIPNQPLLPRAKHPIEVVVNGGGVWTGQVYESYPDPIGDTILIVSTRDSDKPVVKLRSGDYEVKGELGLVPEFGVDQYRFVFRYIPPGDYDVWFEDPELPSEKIPVTVESARRVEVNFRKGVGYTGPTFASPSGWVLGNWTNPSKPGQNIGGWSNILVKTPASGLWVMIESEGGGYKAKCFTGTKGPGACDLAGLNAGLYWIWIDGTDLTLKTYMDGAAYAEFEFLRQPDGPTTEEKGLVGPVSYTN